MLAKEIKIESLTNPLFPLQLGQTKIISSYHKFIHYVDLNSIHNEALKLKSLVNYFKNGTSSKLLHPYPTSEYAQTIANNTINEIYPIIHYTEVVANNTINKINTLISPKRQKRGLINAVGTVNKWLFGTLDADDGEQLRQAIDALNKGQHKIIDQVNLQSSVVKTLVAQVNKTISTISHNQKLMSNYIENIHQNVSYWFRVSRLIHLAQQIINNCQLLTEFIDQIENAISFASINVLHSSLLPINDLDSVLAELDEIYPKSRLVKLEHLQSYYQLFGVKISFSKNLVIFTIQVPLFQPKSFLSYHLYPIPIMNKTIIPMKPILVLGTTYHLLSEEPCPQIEDIFICQGDLRPNQNDCVSQLLSKLQPDHCQTTQLLLTTPIIEQVSQKHVLALTNDVLDVHLRCDESGHTRITKSTLVTLPDDCEIEINGLIFSTNTNYINGSQFSLPEIETMTDLPTATSKPLLLQQVSLDDIHKIQMAMNHVQSLTIDDPNFVSNWKFYAIIAAIICLFAIAALIYKIVIRPRVTYILRRPRRTVRASPNESELRSSPSDPF